MHRETLEVRRRVLGEEHPDTLRSRNNLASALGAAGRHAEAAELDRDTQVAMPPAVGEEHPHTLASRHNLASALDAAGRHAEAAEMYRETLEVMRRWL